MRSEVPTVGGEQSFEELRRELAESREQQAATADILRVISTSPMDLQRAFAEIAASAARLCDANDATIFQVGEDNLRLIRPPWTYRACCAQRMPRSWGD